MYPNYYYDHNFMNYCLREAEKMYPEIYHRLYPHIRRICEREDHMYNPAMHPFPRREIVDQMTDEIYQTITEENIYRSPDGIGGGGDLLRAFITTLLLRELLDRRRFRRWRPFY